MTRANIRRHWPRRLRTHQPANELLVALLLLGILVFAPSASFAQQNSRNSRNTNSKLDPIAKANDHLYNSEYEPALSELDHFLGSHHDDLRALNLRAVVVLRAEMFRRGMLEAGQYRDDGDVFKPDTTPLQATFKDDFNSALNKALSAAEGRLKTDPNDLEALYWAGVAHGTKGTYLFTLERSYTASLGEAKAANRLHRKLLQLDPSNSDALLIPGTQDYIVGSLPWYVKVLAALTGTHGDRKAGLADVKKVAESGSYAREDAKVLLSVLYTREGRNSDALTVLEPLAVAYPRSYLFRQEIGALHRTLKQWKEAANAYDAMLKLQREGAAGFSNMPTSRIAYLAGTCYQHLDDNEEALARFEQASQRNDLYSYRADLASADLLASQQRHKEARTKYQRVAQAAPDSEEGKLARKRLKQYQ